MASVDEKNCDCGIKDGAVRAFPKLSILPNDYGNLVNLPKVNGVTLLGELAGSQLNLLSSKPEDYPNVAIGDVLGGDKYVVLLGEDKQVTKIPVKEFIQGTSGFSTSEGVNPDVAVNAYIFVKK